MKSAFAFVGVAFASNSGSPVEKVVELIQGVLTRTIADGEAEQQIYDKFACWCDTTSHRKANAITTAQNDIRSLGQQILSLKGRIATRTAEVSELAQNIAQNQKDQDLATGLRSKENSEYEADSVERKQAIAAMENAIKVLVTGTSFVQTSAQTATAVKKIIEVLPSTAHVSMEQLSLLSEFASGSNNFAPQSVTIQGILTDMYSTFVTDLEEATQDEASANRKFEDYIYTKQVDQANMMTTKLRKEAEKAEAESFLADATQGYDDTEAQMEADIVFFDETLKSCIAKNKEWVVRKEMRRQEVVGMKEALKILTSDEARAMFTKSIESKATFFLQTSSDSSAAVAAQHAYAVLKKQATKTHSLRLAQLAASVRMAKSGHFDAVITSINNIIKNLKAEEAADIMQRDGCKETFKQIDSDVKDMDWKIEKNLAKIDKLEKIIAGHQDEKAKAIEEITIVSTQMKAMTKQRKQENEAFLNAKKDDLAAISLLELAKTALTKFYETNKVEMGEIQGSSTGAFVQQPFAVSEDQAPEATFSDKGSRKNESKGIVGLMTMLIEELQDEIKNETTEESESQEEYEEEMAAATKLKEETTAKKVNLEETIAKRGSDVVAEHTAKTATLTAKGVKLTYLASIKPDCDWVISSFTQRATARANEMNGLVTAKEYLAGAKVPSLLQKNKFNDNALSSIKFMGMK